MHRLIPCRNDPRRRRSSVTSALTDKEIQSLNNVHQNNQQTREGSPPLNLHLRNVINQDIGLPGGLSHRRRRGSLPNIRLDDSSSGSTGIRHPDVTLLQKQSHAPRRMSTTMDTFDGLSLVDQDPEPRLDLKMLAVMSIIGIIICCVFILSYILRRIFSTEMDS